MGFQGVSKIFRSTSRGPNGFLETIVGVRVIPREFRGILKV